jgi:hypothetical protein
MNFFFKLELSLNLICKVCDDDILIQLLFFWALFIFLLLFKSHNTSETGFCLRLQVEPTLLGPIDTASPYLQTGLGPSIGPNSIHFYLKIET